MSPAKLAVACGILAAMLSGCGIKPKPLAGSAEVDRAPGNHAYVTDPRTAHLPCLRELGLPLRLYETHVGALPAIQVGVYPTGPTIVFEPNQGDAEYLQMEGVEQSAEFIGQALVYPNRASDDLMVRVEKCVAIKVAG